MQLATAAKAATAAATAATAAAATASTFSLVVEHDVRPPDVVGGHVQHVDAAVLRRVPLQLVVVPVLLHPQVRRHDLVLQVLKKKTKEKVG